MAHLSINPSLLPTLKDKVVVLTGGATGIGRSTVKLFHQHGAKIAFGDVADIHGLSLENELGKERVLFIHCDTTKYSDQLALFKTAFKKWGHIDIVVANAGISLPQDPFLPGQDIEKEFSTAEIDVNLKGPLITSRIGLHFLTKNGGDLILVSSIAGWKECTGLVAYTASKHGVIGIMRGLHLSAVKEGVRINVVCPWMTKTAMVKGIEHGWAALNLPSNSPSDVAKSIILCATANHGSSPKNEQKHAGAVVPFSGKILWVSGGESYEIEDNLQRLEPEWLGRGNSEILRRGQEFLMSEGTSWDTAKSKL